VIALVYLGPVVALLWALVSIPRKPRFRPFSLGFLMTLASAWMLWRVLLRALGV
jgi:hypothetical protein